MCGAVWTLGLGACSSVPCLEGFSKDAQGVCRADTPCPQGSVRGHDLDCHVRPDGPPSDAQAQGTTGAAMDTGEGWASDGPGRILVRYDGLSGVPSHGFLVMAFTEDSGPPGAAFCQIILDDPVDVAGFVVPFDGRSDPCPSDGEPHRFEPGELRLEMMVVEASGGSPVLCDERLLTVEGDQEVDYSAVVRCD